MAKTAAKVRKKIKKNVAEGEGGVAPGPDDPVESGHEGVGVHGGQCSKDARHEEAN